MLERKCLYKNVRGCHPAFLKHHIWLLRGWVRCLKVTLQTHAFLSFTLLMKTLCVNTLSGFNGGKHSRFIHLIDKTIWYLNFKFGFTEKQIKISVVKCLEMMELWERWWDQISDKGWNYSGEYNYETKQGLH